jgi:hypothetical protein
MSIEKTWFITATQVPDGGIRLSPKATEAELQALAASLDIIACTSLECELRVRALRQGHYHLTGNVKASVTQACVVSLEPVAGIIEEAIDVEFWPPDQIAVAAKTDEEGEFFDPEAKDMAEPIEGGKIAYGRIVFECLSAGLEPYPRKPDATLQWQQTSESAEVHPFAALAKLKPKP